MNKHNLNKDQIIDSLGYDKNIKDYINKNLIFLAVSGSHAYGMNTKDSDMDIRGMFIAQPENIIGLDKIEQFENKTNDITIYELTKAIKLISEQNPNMHELLFVDKEDIIFATEEYWNIRGQREKFISSLARQKYSGYAMSQLKRIKGHGKWLTQEKEGKFEKKPGMIDFCRFIDSRDGQTTRDRDNIETLSSWTFLTHETNTIFKVWGLPWSNLDGWFDNENYTFYFKEEIDKTNRVFLGNLFFSKDEFNQALDNYNKWKTWKENRNSKRHELEEKYNYDTKHAAHLVRLLRMGYEILTEGKVNVKRPDAHELLEIRNGKWTYNKLLEYAENMDKNVLEEAYKNTKLQRSVDRIFVNELLISTYLKFWSEVKII